MESLAVIFFVSGKGPWLIAGVIGGEVPKHKGIEEVKSKQLKRRRFLAGYRFFQKFEKKKQPYQKEKEYRYQEKGSIKNSNHSLKPFT